MYGKVVSGLDICSSQLRLSTEHHVRGSIIAPGCGSVNQSQLTRRPPSIRLPRARREGWIFNNLEVILVHYFYRGVPKPRCKFGARGPLKV